MNGAKNNIFWKNAAVVDDDGNDEEEEEERTFLGHNGMRARKDTSLLISRGVGKKKYCAEE